MNHALAMIGIALGGVAVGTVCHAWISKEVKVAEADLAGWAQRIRTALAGDLVKAKTDLQAIAVEIEKKL